MFKESCLCSSGKLFSPVPEEDESAVSLWVVLRGRSSALSLFRVRTEG